MGDKRKDRRCGDEFVDLYGSSLAYGRRKRRRIRSLGWATELYGCLDEEMESKILQGASGNAVALQSNEEIDRQVREAVEKLSLEERRFIELFYFEFKTNAEIARRLKKKVYKLERVHRRALDKLRILLTDFVKSHFELDVPTKTGCIICASPVQEELDELIRSKKPEETYRHLIRIFRRKYGIDIKAPQVIIGHQKKHMV
ncbi:MAG: hypothetical protein WCE90_09080 [Candidatus Zixiibacteriota bacterium]